MTHAEDGRIVSGGMDSKICLWDRNSTNCVDAVGHRGSISCIGAMHECIVSSSYDKTVRLWKASKSKATEMGCLESHKSPVLALELSEFSESAVTGTLSRG